MLFTRRYVWDWKAGSVFVESDCIGDIVIVFFVVNKIPSVWT